jgi:Fur family ferric uptake transcriptional regulator
MVVSGSDADANRADRTSAARDPEVWTQIRDELRARGLRWTPQRRLILEVLEASESGHVTGAELVERCRERDPDTTPSTVYRTLDVLEELGYLRHSHSAAGREEFHILPDAEHGHLECRACGGTWELEPADAAAVVKSIRTRFGFVPDVGHLTISGLCAGCQQERNAARA